MIAEVVRVVLVAAGAAYAAQAPKFVAPADSPTSSSPNYVGASNGTLAKSPIVPGKAFDRFIQIWFENTDFNDAATTPAFQKLRQQGILLDQFYAVTHPSEPNYAAVVGGDFWAMAEDDLYNIPANISTVVDLLEEKNISWASYQENLPFDGYQGYNFTSTNYLNTSAAPYTYYVRKHNPTMLYDSVVSIPSRLARHRNFNDFAADVNASALPQWMFITPNIVNDGHDTSIDFVGSWIDYFIPPLLANPAFNDNRTLILLTFDETETYEINNRIFTLLLGGAIPESLRNTTDSTYYTHYSALSSVQANWGLKTLGRQDANRTMSNVFSLVANATGYTNVHLEEADYPLTNLTGVFAGPLNAEIYTPFLAPNMSAKSPTGEGVFVSPLLNTSLTASTAPPPVNLTSIGLDVPSAGYPNGSDTPPGPAGDGSSGNGTGAGSAGGGGGSGTSGSRKDAVSWTCAAAASVLVLSLLLL